MFIIKVIADDFMHLKIIILNLLDLQKKIIIQFLVSIRKLYKFDLGKICFTEVMLRLSHQ